MSRTSNTAVPSLVFIALAVMACSEEQAVSPAEPVASRSTAVAFTELSSPGWQQQARTLVASNQLTAYAAGRLYSILSIAPYRAVVEVDAQFTDQNVEFEEHAGGQRGL